MNKTQSITLGALAVIGVLATWQYLQIQDLRESNSALLQKEKAAPSGPSLTRPAGKKEKNGTAKTIPAKEEIPATIPPEDKEAKERMAQFEKMRLMDRSQRHDAKVLALTTKLNLSPEQQQKLREALQKGSSDRDALREAGDARRRSGTPDTDEIRKADLERLVAVEAEQEQIITSMLGEDQLTEYEAHKTEQKQAGVETRANQQLGELQNKFSLSEDQKEAAFQYFAKQEQTNAFDPSQLLAQGGDIKGIIDQRMKENLETLQQILTPEQFDLYRAQEEQKVKMFLGLFEKAGGSPNGSERPATGTGQ